MRWMVFCIALVVIAQQAQAQTVNPTKVEFTASADHAVVVGGTPVVTGYEFNAVATNATGAIALTRSLGKPAPDAAGMISVVIPELATITPNTTYTATVTAVGPGGNAPSAASDPFARLGPPRGPGKPAVKP